MSVLASTKVSGYALGVFVLGLVLSSCTSSKQSVETTRNYSQHEQKSIEGETRMSAPAIVKAVAKILPGDSEEAHTSDETKFSSREYGVNGSPRVSKGKAVRKGGGRYQVGKKYTIRGRTYYPREDPNYKAVGLASWYGPNFHGRLTANGEVYDQYALSAAHPTLPLPSYVKVTNVENGSSVVVRVNDRGPFAHDRVIDLSARAAELLGYTQKGLAKVKVEYAGKAPLHGLDEEVLVASYNPGKLDPATIPPNGRGYILVANASDKNTLEKPVLAQGFTAPVPSARPIPGIAVINDPVQPVSRPKALVQSYAADIRVSSGANKALQWFNSVDMTPPVRGMSDVTRLRFGSFDTAEEFSRAERILSGFGYVNVETDDVAGNVLVLTTIKQETDAVVSVARENGFSIIPSN